MARKLVTAALNYCGTNGLPNPWLRFIQNRASAKRRGIDFKLTFDEWWTLWAVHYHERGTHRDEYNLCRYLDMGCYEIGNVRIDLAVNNAAERGVAKRTRSMKGKAKRGAAHVAIGEIYSELREWRNPLDILLDREAELIG